jgi:hypothetical protein
VNTVFFFPLVDSFEISMTHWFMSTSWTFCNNWNILLNFAHNSSTVSWPPTEQQESKEGEDLRHIHYVYCQDCFSHACTSCSKQLMQSLSWDINMFASFCAQGIPAVCYLMVEDRKCHFFH